MINKTRLIDEFIELVSVPCPSKDEKQEAELIMAKLRELGLEPEMDKAHEKTGGTCGNVWAYVKGTVPNAPKLLFEAHMDSVAPTTGTKVVRKDGVLYSDGNYLCGYGLPCGLLATGMSNVHTTAEYLKEEDLYNTARWTYEIIKEAAK